MTRCGVSVRCWSLVSLCVLLALGAAVAADVAPLGNPAALDAEIADLIEKLGAEEFATRENAQAKLERLGLQAFDALHQAQQHDDLEVAMRAQKLVRSMQVDWAVEDDTPEVKRILRGYGGQSDDERASRMNRLSKIEDGAGLGALCRLVRFEASRRLSKQAALLVLNSDIPNVPDQRAKVAEVINSTIGLSKRPGALWVTTFGKTLVDAESTVDEWDRLTKEEHESFTQFPERSSREIVRDLLRWQAEMLRKLDRSQQAVAVMQRSIDLLDGSREQILDMVDWLMQRKAWAVVDEVAQRFQARFEEDPELLYRLAESQVQQGNPEKAESVAQRALALTPDDSDSHVVVAYSLQTRGLLQWAEREYRYVMKLGPEGSLHDLRSRLLLSEMLHDVARELDAAQVLQGAVDALEKDNAALEVLRNRLGREVGSMQSRMHYFYAQALDPKADRAKILDHLKQAVAADPTDADVLIAMHRVADPDEAWTLETQKRIDAATGYFRDQIAQAERESSQAPSEPMRAYANQQWAVASNQFAWLVGNTVGDYDEALKESKKSLELRPDTGGYLDTLGRCYFAKGDLVNAIKTQKQAVELEPHSQQIARQLTFFEKAAADAMKENANKDGQPARTDAPEDRRGDE